MKNIFRKSLSCLALLACVVLGSCSTDPDELNTDFRLDRALMPLNVKGTVLATGNQLRMNWDVRSSVAGYEVVVYSDEALTEVVKVESGIVPGDVPVTIDLEVEKSYWATVQAFSADERVLPSRLATEGVAYETYAIMDSLDPEVTERTSTTVGLKWTQDQYVSHLLARPVSDAGADEVKYDLSAGEIAAATATVGGLKPSTEYVVSVCYNSASRGGRNVWTRPDTAGAVEAATAEELLRLVGEGATKILLTNLQTPYDVAPPAEPAGQTNALSTLTAGLSIIGQTGDDGSKPTLVGLAPSLAPGSAAYSLHFEDLVLDGGGKGSVITITANTKIADIKVKNCEIFNYTKGVIAETTSATGGVEVASMTYDGLYVHDIAGSGGDVIDFRFGTYGDVTLVNSTFWKGGRGFVFMQAGTINGKVLIRNNTVSNFSVSTNRKGLICLRAANLTSENFLVEKNVILNEYLANKSFTFISDYSDAVLPAMAANYFFNFYEKYDAADNTKLSEGFLLSANCGLTPELALANGGKVLKDDPCENSAKGKLYLSGATGGQITAAGVGDPRWWSAVAPVIPEQTELRPISEATVFNFADTEVFPPQEITGNKIVGNLQFIVAGAEAPMTITDKGAIAFSRASTVAADGVPGDNALALLVAGPGSLLITPADGGYNTFMSVIANGTSYAIAADGTQSAIGLGDIGGETMIYVIASAPLELKALEWSLDVVSGGEPKALDTPAPVAPAAVDKGTSADIVVTWPAVHNAVAYEVTFNGKSSTVAEPKFTIPAATVATLAAGEYKVSVIAKAKEGSLNFKDSAAAETVVTINGVLETLYANYTWDFTDTAAFPDGDILSTKVFGNLQFIATDSKKLTIDQSINTETGKPYSRIKTNGGSTLPSARVLAFKVAGNGTLTYKVGAAAAGRYFKATANNKQYINPDPTSPATEGYEAPVAAAADLTAQTVTFDDLSGETTIYLWGSAALYIYELSWTPDPSTVPETKEYTMTLSSTAGVLSSNIMGLPTSWKADDTTWTATDDSGASTITFTGNVYYSTDAAKNIVWYFNKGKAETHVAASGLGKIKTVTVYPNSARKPSLLKCTYGGTTLAATEPADTTSPTITFDFATAGVSADNFRIDFTDTSANVEVGKAVIVYEK